MVSTQTIDNWIAKGEAEDIMSLGVYRVLRLKSTDAVVDILNSEPNEWCTKIHEYAKDYIEKYGDLILVLSDGCLFALGSEGSKQFKSIRNRVIGKDMARGLASSGVLEELDKKGVLSVGVFPHDVDADEERREILRENDRFADFRTVFFHLTPRAQVIKHPRWAFYFAYTVIRGEFPKGEKCLSESPMYSYLYARYVLRSRFLAGEKTMIQSPEYREKYLRLLSRLGHDPYTISVINRRHQRDAPAVLDSNEIKIENEIEEAKPPVVKKTRKKKAEV